MLPLPLVVIDSHGQSKHTGACASTMRRRALPMLLLAVALLSGGEVYPQDLVETAETTEDVLLDQEVFSHSLPAAGANDIQFSFPDQTYCQGCDRPVGECGCGGLTWPRLGVYAKAGPSGQWSEGLFRDNTSLGYQVAIGGRELLFPTNRRVFLDFGGSYLSAYGRGEPLTIGGEITRGTGNPQRLNEFMDLTLEEISRAGVHAAIGWFYEVSPTPDESRLLTMRVGGRLSHIHGHFREDATDALQALIDTAVAAGQTISLANAPAISKTDTAPGIFLGVELDHTRYLTPGATVSLLVDGEFASDWIDLRNYADSAMVTATLMFGISLSR